MGRPIYSGLLYISLVFLYLHLCRNSPPQPAVDDCPRPLYPASAQSKITRNAARAFVSYAINMMMPTAVHRSHITARPDVRISEQIRRTAAVRAQRQGASLPVDKVYVDALSISAKEICDRSK
ncbi:hypothetical protein GGR55DRAFT_681553 [Xylaria sp. FL0064]|nr:hypothetical protein GGR55DRAFT_681553 [Xylaria sp. FL0064]